MAFPILMGVGGGVLGFMGGGSITQIINIYYTFLASAVITAIGVIRNECFNIGSFSQDTRLFCDNPGQMYIECLQKVQSGELGIDQCRFYTDSPFNEMIRALCTEGTIDQTMNIQLTSECIIDNTDDFERFQMNLKTAMEEARELFENFDFEDILKDLGERLDDIETPSLNGWQRFTGASVTQVTDLHDNITRSLTRHLDMNTVNRFITDVYAQQQININYFNFAALDQSMALQLMVRNLVNLDPGMNEKVRQLSEVAMDMNELKEEVRVELSKGGSSNDSTVLFWVLGVVGLVLGIGMLVFTWVFLGRTKLPTQTGT